MRRQTLAERYDRSDAIREELAGIVTSRPRTRDMTEAQLAAFMAFIDLGSYQAAAERLGISYQTIKNHLTTLYAVIGATSAANAVYILWPVIGEHLEYLEQSAPMKRLRTRAYGPGNRRMGLARRTGAAA